MRILKKLDQLIYNFGNKWYYPITFGSKNFSSHYTKKHNFHLFTKNSTFPYNSNEVLRANVNKLYNLFLCKHFSVSIVHCKDKSRGKEKKKSKAAHVDLREIEEVYDVEDLTKQMSEAVEALKEDFVKNLTIRSTSGSVETLPVHLGDKVHELQELAQISRKPKFIVLNAAAFPQAIPEILKSIETSGLNINPQQDGTIIYLPIPKVTKEHRENLAESAKTIFIRHRDEIKEIRNRAVKVISKRKDVSEDVVHRAKSNIEALTDKYVKVAESILKIKQAELIGGN